MADRRQCEQSKKMVQLVGVCHLFGPQIRIWKDLGPVSYWSHGASLQRQVYNIKVVVYVPKWTPNWPGDARRAL